MRRLSVGLDEMTFEDACLVLDEVCDRCGETMASHVVRDGYARCDGGTGRRAVSAAAAKRVARYY